MAKSRSFENIRDGLRAGGQVASAVLASRSALRAMPIFGTFHKLNIFGPHNDLENIILTTFRTNLLSWAAVYFPETDLKEKINDARRQLLAEANIAPIGSQQPVLAA